MKERAYKNVIKGVFPKLVMIFGIFIILIGGAMGGNILLYILAFLIIPFIFLKVMKKGDKTSLYAGLLFHVYIAGLVFYGHFLSANFIIFYLIVIYSFIETYLAKDFFITKIEKTP